MKITILDPALCCSTGVCGPNVDDDLVQTAANVKWLKPMGVEVGRHNFSIDGEAFTFLPEENLLPALLEFYDKKPVTTN